MGNNETFNLKGGETGFNTQETKLPTYWNMAFSKICLGMKIDQQINFIVINKHASSLYSLIADGNYRYTSLGRNTWKTVIGSHASLQYNCNKEGFNSMCSDSTASKARIGITADEGNNCDDCDSRIGFGTGGFQDNTNSCGNQAQWGADNGDQHIKAMGYIFIQWVINVVKRHQCIVTGSDGMVNPGSPRPVTLENQATRNTWVNRRLFSRWVKSEEPKTWLN